MKRLMSFALGVLIVSGCMGGVVFAEEWEDTFRAGPKFSGPSSLSPKFTINGDYRIRGFYNNNLTDASNSRKDTNAFNIQRYVLDVSVVSGEGPISVEGHVTPFLTSSNGTGQSRLGKVAFGPDSSASTSCTGVGNEGTGTGCTQNTFSMLQAYLQVNFNKVSLRVGRQIFTIGNALLVQDAVDAFRLDVPLDSSSTVTVANLKILDSTRAAGVGGVFVGNGSAGGPGGDTDLYIANYRYSPDKDFRIDVFAGLYKDRGPSFISQLNPNLAGFGGSATAQAGLYGVAGELRRGNFHSTFEADLIRGTVQNPNGPAPLLQGYNLLLSGDVDLGGGLNAGATFLHSSGQDAGDLSSGKRANMNGINGNYTMGIITMNVGARSPAPIDGTCPSWADARGLGGRPGCYGGSGLTAIKVSANYTPPTMPKLNIEGDVLPVWSARDRAIQSTAGGSQFTKGGNFIGTELDIFVRYQILKDLSAVLAYGCLFTGNYFEAPTAATVGVGNNPVTQKADNMQVGLIEMNYRF
ncbi:MAG: hypothetical protein Q8N04_17995 [Nitrospira sp.]|nr:hypothetical protein [Nitrospira sp.]